MKKFIHTYTNPNEDRINYELINRESDDSLIDYIIDCCKSLEVLEYVKFLGYEYVTDLTDINTDEYIDERSRGRVKKKNRQKYMYLTNSRYGELRLRFQLECDGEVDIITKKLLVPIPDRNGYYTVKGTQYFLMYQIVDNSTYTTKSTLVLKSMMPVSLKQKWVKFTSTDEIEYTAPIYTINIFKKDADIFLFYFAKTGVSKTLKYFSIDKIINFTSGIRDKDKYIYFVINSKMYIEVDRLFFEKYAYVKTMTFMILNVMTNRITPENMSKKSYWIELIGSMGTTNKNSQYEKGLNTLTFFDRIIDDTTKRILKVHGVNKKNIYAILRWMIMNFNSLRNKNNLSLDNKRLRCNEYIASLLTKAFSERVNRIIALGSKATMKNVKEIFRFPGDLLLQQLHRSGLLRYDDRVNDMDFFGKLRTTFKGPNSLGGTNDNNIAAKYRGIDPSYMGRLDINVCGTSDPGTSALLTPFCKTDGLYFDGSSEPEDFKYIFDKDLDNNLTKGYEIYGGPVMNTPEDYYNFIKMSSDINRNIQLTNIRHDNDDMLYIDVYLGDGDDI